MCVDSIQIYWFGPLLGGVAGGKLYDVMFISSSTALRLLKTRFGQLLRRLSRQAVDTAAARSEEMSAEQWSAMTREDGGVWRENSLYGARSVLMDRGVQSELTTRTVAENCLALTVDAVNLRRSPDHDEATPTVSLYDSVTGINDDIVEEEFHPAAMLHRRDSYQRAIMHTDNLQQLNYFEPETLASAAVEEIQQSTLDTVCELEEADVDDAAKEAADFPAETTVEMNSLEGDLFQVVECEKEADRKDASLTRADILDNGSEEFDVTVREEPPTAQRAESCRSSSASVEGDFSVNNIHETDNLHLAQNLQLARVSTSREPEDVRLPDVSSPLSEREVEDLVWIRQTASDALSPDITTANELEQPAREIQEVDTSICVLPAVDQSADECSGVPKLSASPPPPPPIDVIAIDVTRQLLTNDLQRDVEVEPGNVDDEYCHSPLGGAMPESEDSSVAEFVFP